MNKFGMLLVLGWIVSGSVSAFSSQPESDSSQQIGDVTGELEAYLGSDLDAWRILERMTPAEKALLDYLRKARPAELDELLRRHAEQDRVYVMPDGIILDGPPSPQSDDWRLVKVVSLRGVIDQIRAIVSTINARAANIQGRLPTHTPTVRDLFGNLSVGSVRSMMVLVQDAFGPVLDMVAVQRAGFDAFRSGGVDVFRGDLHILLNNLSDIWGASQELVCLSRPAFTPISLQFTRLHDLIDVAPPILLFALFAGLDQLDFDWRFSDIASLMPTSTVCGVVTGTRGGGGVGTAAIEANVSQRFQMARCNYLRDETFFAAPDGTVVAAAKIVVDALSMAAEISEQVVEKTQKDDQVVQGTAVAVGGGGAGTNFKNPLKVAAAIATFVLSQAEKVLQNALAYQQACIDRDAQIEADLFSCTARLSYVLANEDIVFVEDLVERRIAQATVGLPDLQDADTALANAQASPDGRAAFVCMCDAYQRLVLPSDQLPRVACVETPGGGGGGPGGGGGQP